MAIIEEDVVIVGAGIAGLATAVGLKRVGIRALVLERADGLRATGAALSLFPNAWLALDALGVSHKLTSTYASFSKGYITNIGTGVTQEVLYAKQGSGGPAGARAVHRKALLESLAEELPVDAIRFSSKLTSIETETSKDGSSVAVVHLEDGTTVKAKALIGCDGVHSAVARWLGLAEPVYSGRSAVRGLAVYPKGHGLEIGKAHQFLDTGVRAGFAPLNDKEVYWFFTTSFMPKDMSGHPELIQKELLEHHAKHFPEQYLEVVRHADLSELTWAPLMLRAPWNLAYGKLSSGCITVAGDALHPTTPDLGQGGCTALEDAVVLARHLGESFIKNKGLISKNIAQSLDDYVKERRWRSVKLISGSYLSGWIQGSSSWLVKFLRDMIFYKFLFYRLFQFSDYDCGKLPKDAYPNADQNKSLKAE